MKKIKPETIESLNINHSETPLSKVLILENNTIEVNHDFLKLNKVTRYFLIINSFIRKENPTEKEFKTDKLSIKITFKVLSPIEEEKQIFCKEMCSIIKHEQLGLARLHTFFWGTEWLGI